MPTLHKFVYNGNTYDWTVSISSAHNSKKTFVMEAAHKTH